MEPHPLRAPQRRNAGYGGERWLRESEEDLSRSDWHPNREIPTLSGIKAKLPYQIRNIPMWGKDKDPLAESEGKLVVVIDQIKHRT